MKKRQTKPDIQTLRKLPVGAEVIPGLGVHFRVWAPQHQTITVAWENPAASNSEVKTFFSLNSESNGYFSGLLNSAVAGIRYRYQIDDTELYPDPASRFQPQGTDGPSEVIDTSQFLWTDTKWPGISIEGQVIYEMHIGTFTPEGTFESASAQLNYLADTGVTVIELMPLADFPGSFNWGYDGVDLFAPSHIYGKPDDLQHFVNQAHAEGIGVILDVVYNHLGPVDNYLKYFSESYFTDRYKNEWGEAINFDGQDSPPVREFFVSNACYWVSEFHMDGLRIDATQQIFDKTKKHILAEITRKVKETAGARKVILVAENEPQDTILVRPLDQGGYGMDGLWNDDFHHSAVVALTGRNDAYYTDYLGNPQEFISAVKYGYLYQGQYYSWQKNPRGTSSLGLNPAIFVQYIQNHDQIANSCCGARINFLTSPGLYRAMTALLLLSPGTPMLFQGEEFGASSPFYYFSNISSQLAESIHISRLKFLSQFQNLTQPEMQSRIARPEDPRTFEESKLDLSEIQTHPNEYDLHRDLLKLRKLDPVFSSQRQGKVDGAVISDNAFILRYFGDQGDDRLLLFNFGRSLHYIPAPEPLLAPPTGKEWQTIWSSENPRYGGSGTPLLNNQKAWYITGQAALVLAP